MKVRDLKVRDFVLEQSWGSFGLSTADFKTGWGLEGLCTKP